MQRHYISKLLFPSVILVFLVLAGCGSSSDEAETSTASNTATESDLTADQIEKGIGPITNVELGPVDAALATQGEELFIQKCGSCHKLESRYIGPALADVTMRRAPEFIMNMMLNPEEMTKRHPEAKKLLAEYIAPMANQSLTQEEARAILEYLRREAKELDA